MGYIPPGGSVSTGRTDHTRQVLTDAAPVARGGGAASRAVIAANREQPVFARRMLFTQDFGRDREVAIWIEQIAGVAVAMLLVTQVDLSQPRVDAGWRHFAQRFVQPVACLGVATETAGGSSDVQGPGPWDQSATTPQAALLQRNGIEHRGRNIRTLRRDLVGRRRYLLCPGERGSGDRGGQNCNQACIAVHCLCHSPPICRTTAGRSPCRPSDNQRPASWLRVMEPLRTRAGSIRARLAQSRMRASSWRLPTM